MTQRLASTEDRTLPSRAVNVEHTALNSRTNSNNFVWVNTLHWFLAKDFFDLFLDGWHAGHATDKYDGVNFAGF